MDRTLGLIITYRCNAFCDMCCNNSGPARNEEMIMEDALTFIDQAKEDKINNVGITGGEPFLYYEKIKSIVNYCRKKEINVSSLTNAYWARDYESAYRKLKEIKDYGLTKLAISTSEYHEKFVPFFNVKNCVEAGAALGLKIDFRVLIGRNTKKLKDFMNELEITPNKDISMSEHSITRVGRASFMSINEFTQGQQDHPCKSIFNTPVVEPNGDVYACCGVGYKNKELLIGNLKQNSLSELLNKANSNVLFNAISAFGPFSIHDMIKEDGKALRLPSEKFSDICHICSEMLSDEKNVVMITESLQKRSLQINASKIILDQINN